MPSFSTEERQLLHDSVQDYFRNQYPFEKFRELSAPEHDVGFSAEHWRGFAELGWLGVAVRESCGGTGAGQTELAIIMAGAGGALAMEPLLASVVLGSSAIELAGTPEQQAMLSSAIDGETTFAWCHAEPDGGYSREYVTTLARRTADGYVLNGRKIFALHADAAKTLIVSARLESADGPLALFAIPASTGGITRHAAPALDTRRGAAVMLSDVMVDAGSRLGASDADQSTVIHEVLDRGLLAVCAEAAGAMAAVTEQTVEYLKVRKQFNQPLAKFQVLQHRLVDMNICCEEARAATHAALNSFDQGEDERQLKTWRAKVQVGKSAKFVGAQAIQLHGGMGMTDELAIGHYYKRLSMCESLFGDSSWYQRRLAGR